jgi:hypothetical protein
MYTQYYSDKSEGNKLGYKLVAEELPEIYRVNFQYFEMRSFNFAT